MEAVLLCGYRRTGKDSLVQILNHEFGNSNRFQWRVYRSPHSTVNLKNTVRHQGIAFANALKRESSEKYGIPVVVPDSEKDVAQFEHYLTHTAVSARDIYIEWGAIRRDEDPNYWCKKVCEEISSNPSTLYLVTDLRFRNELKYVESVVDHITSVRIFRSEVPIPPMDIPSEHELDNYTTDLLLLRDDDHRNEFTQAITLFPQYGQYVPTEMVY